MDPLREQPSSPSSNTQTTVEVEPYKLSEIFSIVPEYEGDQIFLGNFINACDCAYNMANTQQRVFLVIHIKNKLRGRAAQLISSRNPTTYNEIKQLLNLHFGDSRDLSSLIHDLQRLKQLPNESPLTFFNRLQVLNAKMHASINKSPLLQTREQKEAQISLIETMTLNTLLTGLEPRLGQLIRASNPSTLLEAQSRIRRELQLSYFETQKTNRNPPPKPSSSGNKPNHQIPKCQNCNRIGHTSNQCRQFRPNFSQNQNVNFQRQPFANFSTNPSATNSSGAQPNNMQSQLRGNQTSVNPQFRPSFIPNKSGYKPPHQRAHHVNFENFTENPNSENLYESHETMYSEENEWQPSQEYATNLSENENYQDFLKLESDSDPPIQDPISEIQSQIQTLNLDNMDPNLNFPEEKFL